MSLSLSLTGHPILNPRKKEILFEMPLILPENADAPVLSQFSLAGKIAIVTGGSRGIGLQIVTALAEAGANVAFIYHVSTNADLIATEISAKTNRRIQAFKSDVTDRVRISNTIQEIVDGFGGGRLDIMVVNAGVCQNVKSLEYEPETWDFINKVNYDGVLWTAIQAGKVFKQQGKENLIITASVSASIVNVPQTQAAYNASKAGVLLLAKSLAVEWVDFARVNCVSPGYVQTESKWPPIELSYSILFYSISIQSFSLIPT
jgi:sorbose reductase